MKILMLGSCIARDLIEVGLERGVLSVPSCFARSSIASFSSLPLVDEPLLSRIRSPFQEQCVRADMDKSFLNSLKDESFDLFLIDLAEERFPLLETPDGRLLTLSEEYVSHKASDSVKGTIIQPGSPRYFEKWHQGWNQIRSLLNQRNSLSKVRILQFFWTNRINTGEFIDPIHQNPFAYQNGLLQSHYDFLQKNLPDGSMINIPPKLLVADKQHKWGLSPMHFIKEMHDYALEELLAPLF